MNTRSWVATALFLAGCGSNTDDGTAPTRGGEITYRADVTPVKSVSEAKDGVFIPPYLDCRGDVCTHVAISGATEPGKYFPDYASCDVVRTQRPYWAAKPTKETDPNDPRLSDAAFMTELAWAHDQIASAGCACCHDSNAVDKASQWDISHGPIWLDSLSNTGLALFTGLADSSVLGAYPPADNHGFDRTHTGIPTTDTARMKAFTMAELSRRGLTEADARAVPPFGGPIYTNSIEKPSECGPGEGVHPNGEARWTNGNARYVYVLADGTKNPGVPPNLDFPDGTIWRLDVLASAGAIASGLPYGTTPAGSFQYFPESTPAPALVSGTRYHFFVLADVGIPLANCTFTFGQEPTGAADAGTPPVTDGGAPPAADAGPTCPAGGDAAEWAKACTTSADCACPAPYCAVQPGQTTGYCSATGCVENAALCPNGWSCFDLSQFGAGLPSVCTKP